MTSPPFAIAVLTGATLTVIIATIAGMPVSMTHALTGAIVGGGIVAAPAGVSIRPLTRSFLAPLLFSPVVAVIVTCLLYRCEQKFCRWRGTTKQSSRSAEDLASGPSVPTACEEGSQSLSLLVSDHGTEPRLWAPKVGRARKDSERYLDAAHFLSGGAVCFARALNDTPKMAALLIIHRAFDTSVAIGGVALAMIAGGLIYGRPVAHTLSMKITPMNRDQGFVASLSTALVVVLATKFGLSVSTTHVSVGSLFGIGLLGGQVNRGVVWHIVLSWLFVVPCGAAFASGIYWLIR